MYIDTPFNYTGSKFKLLEQIIPELDLSKKVFFDLFTGGGSIYSNVLDKYDKIIINDILIDLIEIHSSLMDSDEIVELMLKHCPDKNDREGFLQLRDSYNIEPNGYKLWSLILCSTNNMLRFSGGKNGKKFKYNQTWGKRSVNKKTLMRIEQFTNHIRQFKYKVEYQSKHFSQVEIDIPSMVYIDPPYTNTSAGYNCYFSKDDEILLYNYISMLNKNGHSFILSGCLNHNSKKCLILDKLLSDGFNYKELVCDYNKVSRKGDKSTTEIIIKNF